MSKLHFNNCDSRQNCDQSHILDMRNSAFPKGIYTTPSNNSIINFLDNNQDVARIIINYFVPNEPIYKIPRDMMNISAEEYVMVFEEDKEQILQTYHTCETLITLKKLLEKAVRKDLKKNANDIYSTFVKRKYKDRKSSFYKDVRKKIEKLIIDENEHNKNNDLIESLRWCHSLLIKISKVYYFKNKDIFWITEYLEWQNSFESCQLKFRTVGLY